ncbi:UNVERIFIED_CONTAM: hypothetical protein GTU68_052153 [Idotea baltica]|nr:hypothetical protein [Idotea baltica]
MKSFEKSIFIPLRIALLTVSDTADEKSRASAQYLADELQAQGHLLADTVLIDENIYQIRAVVSNWIVDSGIQVILIIGGTGIAVANNTPDAIQVLFDKEITGFGELFRQLSYKQIGTSILQSCAAAGLANHTLIASMPRSINACEIAWNGILQSQLDSRVGSCNFVSHIQAQS